MESKKIGYSLLVLGLALLFIFISVFSNLQDKGNSLGCFANEGCQPIQQSITLINIGFGFFGFILALGAYLVFFSQGDKAIVNRLESHQTKILEDEKFSLILLGLDKFEKQVITAVRKQQGITQNTLRLRVDMSKAKLSQVVSGLEQKGLVSRRQKGKTLAIFLKLNLS